SFFLYDLARGDSLVRDSVMKTESRGARGAGGDSTRQGGGGTDTTSRPAPVYEAQRMDVTISMPRDKPHGTVALRGARIITMKGDEVIPKGDVVVVDNKITAVGPSGKVQIPSGARTIDVSGKTILPGYVDIHAHEWPPWILHKSAVPGYYANLAYGVT